MTPHTRRFAGVVVLYVAGFTCVATALWAVRDGWYALGALGVGLIAVAQMLDRRLD